MEKEMLLTILLGLLVLVSAVQAYQIMGLKDSGVTGAATGATPNAAQGSQPAGSGASLPSGLQNAPDMVGGC